jgi:hypothetical protein
MALRLERERAWAYSNCGSVEEFTARFVELLAVVRSLELLAGFCYTQFADTYQEVNGLLHGDRSPKLPLAAIAEAVAGGPPAPAPPLETRAGPLDE